MSFVRGTRVRLRADFKRDDVATDPDEVVLTVEPPTLPIFQRTLGDGDIINDPDRVGRFYFVLDTSPEAGTWTYQFESTGEEAVVGRKQITVLPRIGELPDAEPMTLLQAQTILEAATVLGA